MGAKPIKRCHFTKDGVKHYARIQRTGNIMPQPARIVVEKEYWEHVGGEYGWETTTIYDKVFGDWDYAHAVFGAIVSRADPGTVRHY